MKDNYLKITNNIAKSCKLMLITVLYYTTPSIMKSPTNIPVRCAIAYVNSYQHKTPGWTHINYVYDPYDLPRSSHIARSVLGQVKYNSTIIYVDFKLTRKYSLDAMCLQRLRTTQQLAVTKHPLFETRSTENEYMENIHHLFNRKSNLSVFRDLMFQYDEIANNKSYNIKATHIMPDNYFMIWKTPSEALSRFSTQWTYEIKYRSMRTQPVFDYIVKRNNLNFQWISYDSPMTCTTNSFIENLINSIFY